MQRGAVVLGPAWSSCGSHQLYKAQLGALSRLGLETYFLAVVPTLNIVGVRKRWWWNHYLRETSDLRADARGEARLRWISRYGPAMLRGRLAARRRLQPFWRTMPARLAHLPPTLSTFMRAHTVEVIICNHYFNLPLALKMRRAVRSARIICETQDIQSGHMIQTDPRHPLTGEPGSYETYLNEELELCSAAEEFIHVSEEEYAVFRRRLPRKRHHLIFPSVPRPTPAPDVVPDIDFLIVASANPPNYRSLTWFLHEIWDEQLNDAATLRIVGNIEYMFRTKQNPNFSRYGGIFMGREEHIAPWYHRARAVLAPVIEGQGISIKTVEALSFGRPFLFSPLALRGFASRPETHSLPGLCRTAQDFRTAIKARLAAQARGTAPTVDRAARALYESLFSPEVYERSFREMLNAPPGDGAACGFSPVGDPPPHEAKPG